MIKKIGGVWGTGVEVLLLGPYTCLHCHRVAQPSGHTDCSCHLNHSDRCAPCVCVSEYAGSHASFMQDMDCGTPGDHPGVACIDLHDETNSERMNRLEVEWIEPFPLN